MSCSIISWVRPCLSAVAFLSFSLLGTAVGSTAALRLPSSTSAQRARRSLTDLITICLAMNQPAIGASMTMRV